MRLTNTINFAATPWSPSSMLVILGLAAVLASAPDVRAQGLAQRPAPRVGYAYPAGGQQGTTFNVAVGGQNLNGVTEAHFTGAGMQAKVIGYDRPLTPKEFTELREKLQQLRERREAAGKSGGTGGSPSAAKPTWTVEDEKILAALRMKLADRLKRQANPAIAETVTLEVTLAPDAPLGEQELRLQTPGGLSNPLVFCIGQLPEFRQKAAVPGPAPRPGREAVPRSVPPKAETEITLPAIMNGQILPGEADRFRFAARKGQRLVVAVSARALIPYLADAVPGWFQATLALFDSQGHELAYDDHFRFNPDPVLSYEVPEDGDYTIEIHDSLYRGREDFVYRIAVGELPFVTGIFPLGCPASARTPVALAGWNLPLSQLTVDPKDNKPGTLLLLSVRNNGLLSNTVPFALDTLPECPETEPNDRPENAQPLTLPVIVNGRIDRPDDWDVFRFEGRAGSEIVAEVFARRLNSPLDSVLKLTDATGRQLAFNDDYEDKGSGLTTHHADSRISIKLPADGSYYLWLGDAQHQSGAEYGYRLHVGPARPDFELRVVPSSINVRGGTSVPVTVYALRKDGFTGEIALDLADLARTFTLSGARIPANQDKVRLTLTAPANAADGLYAVTFEGRATIQGRQVIHPATPAEDMMQAFAYRHLVPSRELRIDVAGRGPALQVLAKIPVRIPVGGEACLRVAVPASRFLDNIQLELSEPPDGIAIKNPSPGGGNAEVILSCDAAKAKPGLQGNLILMASGERGGDPAKGQQKQRVPLGAFPAIPFEIVAP
jgi:hypothetical protein